LILGTKLKNNSELRQLGIESLSSHQEVVMEIKDSGHRREFETGAYSETKKPEGSKEVTETVTPAQVGRCINAEMAKKLRIAVENEMSNNPFRYLLRGVSNFLHSMFWNKMPFKRCTGHHSRPLVQENFRGVLHFENIQSCSVLGFKIQNPRRSLPNLQKG